MAGPKYNYARLTVHDIDLDLELPEPDYFDLEKIYYEPPPPSLFKLAMKWTVRNLCLLLLLSLFLVASVLYISNSIPERPSFNQILRTSFSSQKQIQSTTTESQAVQIDVAGSDVVNTDADDLVIDAGDVNVTAVDNGGLNVQVTPSNTTTTIANGNTGIDSNPSNSTTGSSTSNNKPPSSSSAPNQGGSKNSTATSKPVPPKGGKDGGVSIQNPIAAEQEPFTPIKATFFSGVEGPTHCRGHVIAVINMPKPQASGVPTPPECYNFPNMAYSGCGTFMANKVDGCIANFFEEPNCRTYMNTAAFMPENRAIGGHWRSVQVQCGVPEPDPETLGKPPMVDQIASLQDNDKKPG